MVKRAKDDEALRKLAAEFFSAAWAARCKSAEETQALFKKRLGFRIMGNTFFSNGPEVQRPLGALVRRCIKVLGSKAGHEGDIEEAAWKHAAQAVGDEVKPVVKAFMDDLDALGAVRFTYIAPNYAIQFEDGIREIVIGPVRACVSDVLAAEIRSHDQNPALEFAVGVHPGVTFANKKMLHTLAPVSWEVTVTASRGNVEEEALWLVNVAVGLLRLSYPTVRTLPFFPMIGDAENDPTLPPDYEKRSMVSAGKGIGGGGWHAPLLYIVNKALLNHLQSTGFADRANKLFHCGIKTVGERVFQGLGWMTRGRQARDRSERLLFFFTAIEALLSGDDKTAPVTQTIARRAATILVDDPTHRLDIFRSITRQYETRSALVHGGRRNVSNLEAKDAQSLVETLYWTVLGKISLSTSSEKFEEDLAQAGFGLPWPLASSND